MQNELEIQLAGLAKANFDLFLLDLQDEDVTKSIRAVHQEAEIDHQWAEFRESCEQNAAGVDLGHAPRLRSEDRPDPDFDGGPLEKRAPNVLTGPPNSTRKSATNGWTQEFDSMGNLVRAYANHVDPAVAFARI